MYTQARVGSASSGFERVNYYQHSGLNRVNIYCNWSRALEGGRSCEKSNKDMCLTSNYPKVSNKTIKSHLICRQLFFEKELQEGCKNSLNDKATVLATNFPSSYRLDGSDSEDGIFINLKGYKYRRTKTLFFLKYRIYWRVK